MKGFTLLEVIISVAIMATITTLGVMSFLHYGEASKLSSDAAALCAKISEMKIKAFSGHKIDGKLPKAYGLAVKKTAPSEYLAFADWDGDCQLDAKDVILETIRLSPKIFFSYLPAAGKGICFLADKKVDNLCLWNGACGATGNYYFYLSAESGAEIFSVGVELSSGTTKISQIK